MTKLNESQMFTKPLSECTLKELNHLNGLLRNEALDRIYKMEITQEQIGHNTIRLTNDHYLYKIHNGKLYGNDIKTNQVEHVFIGIPTVHLYNILNKFGS